MKLKLDESVSFWKKNPKCQNLIHKREYSSNSAIRVFSYLVLHSINVRHEAHIIRFDFRYFWYLLS